MILKAECGHKSVESPGMTLIPKGPAEEPRSGRKQRRDSWGEESERMAGGNQRDALQGARSGGSIG